MNYNKSIHKNLFFLIIYLLYANSCQSDLGQGVNFDKGPWLQNQKETGITIMWETKTEEKGHVEYGTNNKLKLLQKEKEAVQLHKVILSGLKPETTYQYRVVSGERKGRVFTFQTAVKENGPFTLAVYGDNKIGPFNHEKIAGLILSKNPNLVINNGDLVNRGRVYEQWGKLFFTPIRELAARIPVYPVMGNHENNAEYYYEFFDPPVNNVPYYSFNYGNAHIIILNSEEEFLMDTDEQINWLKKDLEQHRDAEWKFVMLHIPPFTCGGNYYARYRLKVKKILVPVFLEYGVDMVFSGHDHDYERTFPVASKTGGGPTTFVVCGNGGTPMRHYYPREFTKYAERVYGFTLLQLKGKTLHFQSININNEVIDEFILDKSDPASIEYYKKGLLFYEEIEDASREVAGYYQNGHKAQKNDDYIQAIKEFQKAIEMDTTCYQAMGEMAVCYSFLGKNEEAIHYGMKAQKEMPTLPYSYKAIIKTYKYQKKYSEALKWCRELYKYTSDSPEAFQKMSEIYLEMGDTVKSIEFLGKALDILPNDREILLDLAELNAENGDINKAVELYKESIYWDLDEEKDEDYFEAKKFIRNHK
jgi:tetratricopeptide (TPR) repeat protein